MFKNTIRSKFFITLLVLLALVFSTFSFASAASATGKMGDRRLSVGCRGTDVSTLQTALKDKGFCNELTYLPIKKQLKSYTLMV